jgi:hypothetical protein
MDELQFWCAVYIAAVQSGEENGHAMDRANEAVDDWHTFRNRQMDQAEQT